MLSKLTQRQQDVVDFLRANDGEANESALMAYLGIPVHSVRGLLNRLEEKGVISTWEARNRMQCGGGGTTIGASLIDK